jgi:hypothetical protein
MVYRVKEAFSFDSQGVPVTLRVGALLEDNDPRVEGHHTFLEKASVAASRTAAAAETATAEPGELRHTTVSADVEALQRQATRLGVKVDRRWAVDRLRQEIAKAEQAED